MRHLYAYFMPPGPNAYIFLSATYFVIKNSKCIDVVTQRGGNDVREESVLHNDVKSNIALHGHGG